MLKRERTLWTNDETRAFLLAYNLRKEEFQHIKKRKTAMQNVFEDLQAQGDLQPKTINALELKLKILLQAWKATKDNNTRTGASPSTAPFGELMEDIFGNRPIICNTHTINLSGQTARPLQTRVSSLPLAQRKTGPSSSLKKKYYDQRLQQKKVSEEKKLQILENYHKEKLLKMDEAERNRDRRHLQKMTLLGEILKKKMKMLL